MDKAPMSDHEHLEVLAGRLLGRLEQEGYKDPLAINARVISQYFASGKIQEAIESITEHQQSIDMRSLGEED